MSCTSCKTSEGRLPKGCRNNGACGADNCNKLTVFDWLANMEPPEGQEPFDHVEVRFKNGRKEFFRNTEGLPLKIGDIVAVEAYSGHDIGTVTLTGELVRVQMKKKKAEPGDHSPKVYRMASQRDMDNWEKARAREQEVMTQSRQVALAMGLHMKISDVEFQGDSTKATFYYTADARVDFRELIRELARRFSIRVEMRQVGLRQEAGRLGGIGSCGRELCCATWLTDFRSVGTAAARYQQLSINPQKLSGQCGKLKCCLNYELDTYMDALKDFPDMETRLETEKGRAICQKFDIFKRLAWYAYEGRGDNPMPVSVADANKIIAANRDGKKVPGMEPYVEEPAPEPAGRQTDTTKIDLATQDSITRFDQPKNRPVKRRRNKRRRPGNKK